MRITIVGTGYVGLVTGACFAEMGNKVICVDKDLSKIEGLKNGEIPIYEPGLKPMVIESYKKGALSFTNSLFDALSESEIVFIAVGTPQDEDGSADLSHVINVANEIGEKMKQSIIVVDKSTVPVGTADKVRATIQNALDSRGEKIDFDVVSNPEFLKEGTAIKDFMQPDRVVIGSENQNSINVLKELYRPFTINRERFINMDIKSAEMTKYAANAFLATKISFMNEMSNICERVGADVNMVRMGIGSDNRIGYKFIYPGCGYGGSCFPKDVKALEKTAEDFGYTANILKAVEKVNANQKRVLLKKIKNKFGENLTGKCFAIWGLSFKPGTDDMREAASIVIINGLIEKGATIKAYDPKAMKEAKEYYFKNQSNISYCEDKYDALAQADALVLITEWKEFRSPDFSRISSLLNQCIIFDGRNQYDKQMLKKYGYEYYQIGVK
ncbi:MAG: UDP-glucose/GDP-mannose dehydrogenase family protein [Flavobacteriales bacterium]|nr:UDP-glucose/GDP-mannose dehydrogenase family protein [Flavobacteriales bacterium]